MTGLIPRVDVLGWIYLLWLSIWNNSNISIIFKTTFIGNKWITLLRHVTTIVSQTIVSRSMRSVTDGRDFLFIPLQLLQKDNNGHMAQGIFEYVFHNGKGSYFYKTLITSDVTRALIWYWHSLISLKTANRCQIIVNELLVHIATVYLRAFFRTIKTHYLR